MSEDFKLSRPVESITDAAQFLYGAFYRAGLNLNPDLGFLKADNTSAFDKLSDRMAQFAQMRLIEAEKFFEESDSDIWEACTEMSIYITTHAYCHALFSETNTAMKSDDWLEYVRTYHDEAFMSRSIHMLAEETKETKELRRKAFILDTISQLHSMHPICAEQMPTAWNLGNGQKAAFLCTPLLPTGWESIVDEHMKTMGGIRAGEFSLPQDISAEEREKIVQDVVNEVNNEYGLDPDDPDFDDDPTRGLNW